MAGKDQDLGSQERFRAIRHVLTRELGAADVGEIRSLLFAAFAADEHGGFGEDDWQHALGGVHFVLELDGSMVGHAAVVERAIQIAGRPLRTGYVEAVAVDPRAQRTGLGTLLMRDVNAYVREHFELGALGTGSQAFYERLGWRTWQGRSSVRTASGEELTPDEDGYILILRTPSSPTLRLTDPISCEWRPGDAW